MRRLAIAARAERDALPASVSRIIVSGFSLCGAVHAALGFWRGIFLRDPEDGFAEVAGTVDGAEGDGIGVGVVEVDVLAGRGEDLRGPVAGGEALQDPA